MTYYKKLKICGRVAEEFYYPSGIFSGSDRSARFTRKKKEKRAPSDMKFPSREQIHAIYNDLPFDDSPLKRHESSVRRARSQLRALVNCNASDFIGGKFITLTFAPILKGGKKFSFNDLDLANRAIHKTILNIRDAFGLSSDEFKYVVAVQFQKDSFYHGGKKINGGAIHYHVATNIADDTYQYEDFEKLVGWDKYGSTNNRKIDSRIQELGQYMTRYFQKDFADPRLKGRKAFWGSHNLKKPVFLYDSSISYAKEEMGITAKTIPIVEKKPFNTYYGGEGFYTLWRLEYDALNNSKKI